MDSKRILLTYALEYPHIGGLSTHMQLIGDGLRQLGNEVEYLSYSSFPKVIQLIFFEIPSYIFDRIYPGLGSVIYFKHVLQLFFNLVICFKLLLRKYDIINSHHIFSTPYHSLMKLFKIPVILTAHTYFTYEMLSMGILKKDSKLKNRSFSYEKRAYNSVSHIITVDNKIKDYLMEMNMPESKIDVMFNPVNTDVFRPDRDDKYKYIFGIPKNKKVILCPRRLQKKNGVIYPILALLNLSQKDNIVLVYAGEGPERDKMEKVVMKHGLENNILFLGSVPHDKMKILYNVTDLVLIPSIHSEGMEEATSISALESMASGVPVIASNIGGLKDIIKTEYNGILIPDKNEKELANAIDRLLNDKTLYNKLCRNSIDSVKNNYSYISRAEFILNVIEIS